MKATDSMNTSGLDERSRQFLMQLFERTQGDPSAQTSMYAVGESLGMDRDTSCRVAETLIGLQLVEIRTLSGGIGISPEGSAEARGLMGDPARTGKSPGKLSDRPVMDPIGCQTVQQVADEIKNQAGRLGLNFDGISALMADLKTIDAQLGSSRPKTAIIRECLRSLEETLGGSAEIEIQVKLRGLLGD
jgi:hypothetical protein